MIVFHTIKGKVVHHTIEEVEYTSYYILLTPPPYFDKTLHLIGSILSPCVGPITKL